MILNPVLIRALGIKYLTMLQSIDPTVVWIELNIVEYSEEVL